MVCSFSAKSRKRTRSSIHLSSDRHSTLGVRSRGRDCLNPCCYAFSSQSTSRDGAVYRPRAGLPATSCESRVGTNLLIFDGLQYTISWERPSSLGTCILTMKVTNIRVSTTPSKSLCRLPRGPGPGEPRRTSRARRCALAGNCSNSKSDGSAAA